jgi:hypothetical protein
MVASFVQKAVVITDDDQREVIQSRLAVKHRPCDKILFSYEDITNVAEAVNALKVLLKRFSTNDWRGAYEHGRLTSAEVRRSRWPRQRSNSS